MQSFRKTFLCVILLASMAACGGQAVSLTPVTMQTTVPTINQQPAASSVQLAGGTVSITDATGTILRFDAPPQRVVCLYHECIESMSGLGVTPVAMLAPSWLPNFAADPAYFPQPNTIVNLSEQDSGSWDYEQIAALKPEIVFGSNDDRIALEGIAPVYSIGDSYSMTNQDTLDHMLEFGRLFGRESEAQNAIKGFHDRLAAYTKLAPKDRSVLLVASDLELAWIYSGKSVPCSILNLIANCDWPNPTPQPGSWGYASTVEEVLKLNPDVIILENWSTLSNAEALAKLKTDPLWSELQAFKHNRVYTMQNRDAYGLGPVGGARLLDLYVPRIYPEVFPNALSEAQVKEILAQ